MMMKRRSQLGSTLRRFGRNATGVSELWNNRNGMLTSQVAAAVRSLVESCMTDVCMSPAALLRRSTILTAKAFDRDHHARISRGWSLAVQ